MSSSFTKKRQLLQQFLNELEW